VNFRTPPQNKNYHYHARVGLVKISPSYHYHARVGLVKNFAFVPLPRTCGTCKNFAFVPLPRTASKQINSELALPATNVLVHATRHKFLSIRKQIWSFSTYCYKISPPPIFLEVRPLRPALIRADRRTDGHDEGNGVFRYCEHALKERLLIWKACRRSGRTIRRECV
jgi:hypothetical protein